MKFYHVRQKSSPKEQQVTVKELFATFFAFIFLTGSGDTCDFEGHDPIANYFESIEKLRINLPTDYNLTVLLQDTAGMDSCCSDLQAILSLNRSIGHIHRNSVGPLQDIVTMVIMELEFLTDCTVKESFNCEVTRWNSTHLLQNLLENLHSFKALVKSRKCRFNECILYTCTPGHIMGTLSTATSFTLTSTEQLGIPASGADHIPMATEVPTSLSNETNLQSPLVSAPPTNQTNRSDTLPSLNSGNLANGSKLYPSTANGSVTTLTNTSLALTSDALNNESHLLSSAANTSLINGTNSRPVNVSQSTVDDQSNANPTSLTISNEGYVLATRECRSQVTSLMSRIVAVVLVFSVFANAILLSCLVRKKRQGGASGAVVTEAKEEKLT
ncbi:uncharacterized protein LOC127585603 isoform X2 [Pristis pectinata]|uniref:uncharacterized protein LOC127585603 isoform X2 n=1 Tax=Pristis pectinata TaxID=685728 RepID=UPI00223C8F89|nr:uncharacterized protein LOC127585603 isoform X2 [Pristis pectinata]